MPRLAWRKTGIEAVKSTSGESSCFFVLGWRGYQLVDFACSRNNGTQCKQEIKKIYIYMRFYVSQFKYNTTLCLGHEMLLSQCFPPPRYTNVYGMNYFHAGANLGFVWPLSPKNWNFKLHVEF